MYRAVNLVDGGYFEKVQKTLTKGKIDFEKLATKMSCGMDLLRTYYYHCLPYLSQTPSEEEKGEYQKKQSFFKYLEYQPNFEVRYGRLEFRGLDSKGERILEQKRVDILLGVDLVMLSMKKLITHVCILAGDSDFIPAIAVAKYEGVVINLFHGPDCHEDLRQIADSRIEVNEAFMKAILAEEQSHSSFRAKPKISFGTQQPRVSKKVKRPGNKR